MRRSSDALSRLLSIARNAPERVDVATPPDRLIHQVQEQLRQRRMSGSPAPESTPTFLEIWSRLTPWAAGIAAGSALVITVVAGPWARSSAAWDDPAGWETQIEAWVFLP
jgi:hypothetical protein